MVYCVTMVIYCIEALKGQLILVPKSNEFFARFNPSRAPIGHHGFIEVGVNEALDVRHAWRTPHTIQFVLCPVLQGP